MRTLLLLCALLVACNPQQRALKSARKHWSSIQDLLMKYPELADTLELVKRDTIRLEGFRDSAVVVNDSTIWGDEFFKEVDTLAANVVKAPENKKASPVTKLQRKICPEFEKDSTYHILVYNSTVKRYIPIHLKVKVKDGKASFSILAADVKVADPQIVKQVEFKPVKPVFYKDQWFWVAVITLLVLLWALRSRNT